MNKSEIFPFRFCLFKKVQNGPENSTLKLFDYKTGFSREQKNIQNKEIEEILEKRIPGYQVKVASKISNFYWNREVDQTDFIYLFLLNKKMQWNSSVYEMYLSIQDFVKRELGGSTNNSDHKEVISSVAFYFFGSFECWGVYFIFVNFAIIKKKRKKVMKRE